MIRFFKEDTKYTIPDQRFIKRWISDILNVHKLKSFSINYIFCSDDYLLEINRSFLQHDYYTDIITFDNSVNKDSLQADIFISVDRIQENATLLKIDMKDEMHRVLAHGVLHLIGFNDKTSKDKQKMSIKENECLILRKKHYIR